MRLRDPARRARACRCATCSRSSPTKEIAKFKLPERLEIMSDFPLSTFGKVSKKALVETVSAKIAQERAPATT